MFVGVETNSLVSGQFEPDLEDSDPDLWSSINNDEFWAQQRFLHYHRVDGKTKLFPKNHKKITERGRVNACVAIG